jgi:hypothetical protein
LGKNTHISALALLWSNIFKGFYECFGDFGDLGIHPRLKANKGTKIMMLNRPKTFPL